MASTSQIKSVMIVGGSLAGLMHALTLLSLPNPPTVRVLERSATTLLHNQGAGIVAQSETQEFFEKYVRPGRDITISSNIRHYLNRNGEVMPQSVEYRSNRMTSWDLAYHLLRWRVDGMESEYVEGLQSDNRPKAQYMHGCTVTNIEDAGNEGIKLTWTLQEHEEEQVAVTDMVIAADGPSSTIRRLLQPEVERRYAGYVAWRGTVPENELSDAARETLIGKFTFSHTDGSQILSYLIPGENGTLERGKRLLNWVWYYNYKENSTELDELMTDIHGKRHHITLPVGTMNPQVWAKQKEFAAAFLPPQYGEAVQKTKQPFVQAITDVISPKSCYINAKVLLVGDALAGFRPHPAASTSQAAHDAMRLDELMTGKIDRTQYETSLMEYARSLYEHGVMLGERSQFGKHPLAG